MTKNVEDIISTAKRLHACGTLSQITDLKSAIEVLLTPQGREFALNTHYPTLQIFRENKEDFKGFDNVFVDSGAVVSDCRDIVAVGDSDVVVYAIDPKSLYHIVVMHGATVRIDARNYAVVTVTSVNGNVESSTDGTAIIKIEE